MHPSILMHFYSVYLNEAVRGRGVSGPFRFPNLHPVFLSGSALKIHAHVISMWIYTFTCRYVKSRNPQSI